MPLAMRWEGGSGGDPRARKSFRCMVETHSVAGGVARELIMNVMNVASIARAHGRSEALQAALVALCVGLALVYLAGFAHPTTIHNAAHDTRHALSFPCH
jgi:cobalt transporter subunit CbtB